jgi:hypothetical protein
MLSHTASLVEVYQGLVYAKIIKKNGPRPGKDRFSWPKKLKFFHFVGFFSGEPEIGADGRQIRLQ